MTNRIDTVVCSLQFHESLHRDKVRISFGQFQLQSFSEFSERSDFRQKEENSSEEDFATDGKPFRQLSSPSFSSIVASAARRHCLYHRFKAFRPSPRSSFTSLKRLYPRARSRVPRFLPLRDVSEVTPEFIVTGGKTVYLRRKRRCRFPVD